MHHLHKVIIIYEIHILSKEHNYVRNAPRLDRIYIWYQTYSSSNILDIEGMLLIYLRH